VGCGGAVLSLIVGGGIAYAEPDMSAIVNSTCTYPQVMAALNAQSPGLADQVSASPMANAWVQQLVAAPPDQRQQMLQEAQTVPGVQQYTGLIVQVAGTCQNF
jgi:hemophore-related protein